MRKLFSLIAATLFLSVATYGQIQNEKGNLPLNKRTIPLLSSRSINTNLTADFESSNELPLAWTTSVSNPWFVDDDGSGTNNIVIFNMWDYANNAEGYLYTPEMQITSVDSILTCEIEYYLVGGNYGSAGKLYVDVSTNGGSTWTSSTTNLLTGHAGTGVFTFSLNFSNYMSNNYIGQNVKVRFKGVSDYGSYNIAIDNVQGPALVPHTDDISVNSINTPDAVLVGPNVDITGTIRNLSNQEALTSFDLTYSIDGGAQVATYNISGLNVASGAYYNFTHNIPWVATPGSHTLAVTVSNPNGNTDINTSNNATSKNVLIVNEVFPRVIVAEEQTGTKCQYCLAGKLGMETMDLNNPSNYIGIEIHSSTFGTDPMTVASIESAFQGIYGSGQPHVALNRLVDDHPAADEMMDNTFINDVRAMMPVAKAEINSLNYNTASREITFVAEATFAVDITGGNFGFAVAIIEDNVTGTTSGYSQVNGFNGTSTNFTTPITNIHSTTAGNPIPAANMVYAHVARAYIGGFLGNAGSIPTDVTYNNPVTYSFNYTIPAAYDENEIEVVVMIINRTTGEVVNAVKSDLSTGISKINKANFNIYPNPTTGLVNIEGAEGAQVLVYNMIGEVVYSVANTTATTSMDLSSLQSGNYIVKVINNKEVATLKIVLTK